jgi:tetratricopeptide (TPR) repeat protein
MNDDGVYPFLRSSFLKMRKGQVSFIKVGPSVHNYMFHRNNLEKQKTQEEKEHMKKAVGADIFVRIHITNIKRDPKCAQTASWEEKCIFFDKVRQTGKELCEEGEFSNAKNLYSRCISLFKNMPKTQKETLNDEQRARRDEILNVLHLNCAHCLLQKKMYADSIKFAKEAIGYVKHNPKAHYRLYLAYKESNDLDRAKESLLEAIKLEPNDKRMREEYKKLIDTKSEKERMWNDKMKGFYNTKKLTDLETEEHEERVLREKIKRQTFGDE